MEFLSTRRLVLRNFLPEDLHRVVAYRNREACNRYQRWEAFTPEAVAEFIARFQQDVFLSEQEEQHYAIALSENGQLVGDLAYFFTPGDCVTLGITISDSHHRRGFARELLTACITRIRQTYRSLDIVALIEPENKASVGLFEALGFTLECYAEKIQSLVYVLPPSKEKENEKEM